MSNGYLLCAPCLFGLEGPLSSELKKLGAENISAEDGRVYFSGDAAMIAKANLRLRTAERVMITAGRFAALSFDELFENTKQIAWEQWLPKDAAFPVRGHCTDSQLMSVPDCRAIIKKAIASRLGAKYGVGQLPESGEKYMIRFTIIKNKALLYVDTTGDALHKRGYRELRGDAALRETLAAGLVLLSGYRGKDAFADPFCGSGTIAIEAAMIAKNRAPGLYRSFDFENWHDFKKLSVAQRDDARSQEFDRAYDIWGGDIDPAMTALSAANAEKARLGGLVRFETADMRGFSPQAAAGKIVTNPPYGKRLLNAASTERLMKDFGAALRLNPGWDAYILTSDADLEIDIGKRASKKRKLYNGMLRCDLYAFTAETGKREGNISRGEKR